MAAAFSAAFPVDIETMADGSMLLRPGGELPPYPAKITERLVDWAGAVPERVCFAQRDDSGAWRALDYRDTLARVRRIGSALLDLGLSAERPLAILSGNGLEHQLLSLGAMYAGIPYVAVSPAYSLIDHSLGRIRHVAKLMTPGMVAVFGAGLFDAAIECAADADAPLLTDVARGSRRRVIDWAEFECSQPTPRVDEVHRLLGSDAIAKFLLTSGSTGIPKAVTTTHRMICSNQAMLQLALPFLASEPPVLVDWLPWNHVFGGSHNVGLSLMHGGSFYIDSGRPTVEGFRDTVRNLREISPTIYFNVPKGFEALAVSLERDEVLRKSYFRRLRANFFAGASLAQPVWDALDRVAEQETGARIPMITGLGATETGPSVTFTTPEMCRAGSVGLPVAGELVKLVPVGGKLEIRVRGPNVTPGYWRQPELDGDVFDDEGFYRLGDAVKWVDPRDRVLGLLFDGRICEDFKLSSGTWVSVGPLRLRLLDALAPLVADVVIGAPERDFVTALVFLDPIAAAGCAGEGGGHSLAALARSPQIRCSIGERLRLFNAEFSSSSMRVARALLLDSPPSLAEGEVTDKGSINQRIARERRAEELNALYSGSADGRIIVVEQRARTA